MTGSVWRILGATCGLCMVVWLAAACAQASPDRGAPAATEPAPTLDVASTLAAAPPAVMPSANGTVAMPSRTEIGVPPNAAATPAPRPAGPAAKEWAGVQTWVYQLHNYQDDRLDQLAASQFDLAVIDLARDGAGDYFTADEIAALKASSKIVLAYFEIGAIENYRPEVASVPADLKLGPVVGWPDEFYVRYWDERWWPVVQGRIDQALAAGFDGAYLDMIVTYEEIPANAAGTARADLASKMVDLIAQVSQYARSQKPGFKVVPQNNPELWSWPKYLPAIDGLGMEQMYYQDTASPCNLDWCQANRADAAAVRQAGKLVLSIDYTSRAAEISSAYRQARSAGFVPYVSTVDLDHCYQSGLAPLAACHQ